MHGCFMVAPGLLKNRWMRFHTLPAIHVGMLPHCSWCHLDSDRDKRPNVSSCGTVMMKPATASVCNCQTCSGRLPSFKRLFGDLRGAETENWHGSMRCCCSAPTK